MFGQGMHQVHHKGREFQITMQKNKEKDYGDVKNSARKDANVDVYFMC